MKQKSDFEYISNSCLYSQVWGQDSDDNVMVCTASFEESSDNFFVLFTYNSMLCSIATQDVDLPITSLAFSPRMSQNNILATGSDFVRLWSYTGSSVQFKSILIPSKNIEKCGPITSMKWNKHEYDELISSSSDTTICIWSISKVKPKVRLIAHDYGVNDITISPHKDIFATCAFDSSVRIFDQRDLTNSIIIYESKLDDSFIKIDWNQIYEQYVFCVSNKEEPLVLDIRFPDKEYAKLNIKQIEDGCFSPVEGNKIVTIGPGRECFLWDQRSERKPRYAWNLDKITNTVEWNEYDHTLLSVTSKHSFEIIKLSSIENKIFRKI